MSRVGKYPVSVPAGVTVSMNGDVVTAKGKLGELSYPVVTDAVDVEIKGSEVSVAPKGSDRRARTMWGTTRSLINSMCIGVSTGFSKSMEITGTGYRAAMQGNDLVLNLGYSHEIRYAVPAGIKIVVERPTAIKVEKPVETPMHMLLIRLRVVPHMVRARRSEPLGATETSLPLISTSTASVTTG